MFVNIWNMGNLLVSENLPPGFYVSVSLGMPGVIISAYLMAHFLVRGLHGVTVSEFMRRWTPTKVY